MIISEEEMWGTITNWYTNTHKFTPLQCRAHGINGVAERNANTHCDEDPYYEEAIEE